jgi:cell division protein FtsX
MERYINLLMGLASGLVLMILNNNIVRSSLTSVFQFFDPTFRNPLIIFLHEWSLRLIIILSLIGIIITITCSFLIIRKILKK